MRFLNDDSDHSVHMPCNRAKRFTLQHRHREKLTMKIHLIRQRLLYFAQLLVDIYLFLIPQSNIAYLIVPVTWRRSSRCLVFSVLDIIQCCFPTFISRFFFSTFRMIFLAYVLNINHVLVFLLQFRVFFFFFFVISRQKQWDHVGRCLFTSLG